MNEVLEVFENNQGVNQELQGILAATAAAEVVDQSEIEPFGTQLMEEYDGKNMPLATNGPTWSSGKNDDEQGDTGPGQEF